MASGKVAAAPQQKVVIADKEILVTTRRLALKETKEINSPQTGFVNAGVKVAVRKRDLYMSVPKPTKRVQVATPGEVAVLGWIDEERDGEPTLVPEAPSSEPSAGPNDLPTLDALPDMPPLPGAAPAGEMAVTVKAEKGGGFGGWLAGIGASVAKIGAAMAGAMALHNLFGSAVVDKSDAGLTKAFEAVDTDGSGSMRCERPPRNGREWLCPGALSLPRSLDGRGVRTGLRRCAVLSTLPRSLLAVSRSLLSPHAAWRSCEPM